MMSHIMANVFVAFDDQHVNIYMGPSAQKHTVDDYNADNFDHGDTGFIRGSQISIGTGNLEGGPISLTTTAPPPNVPTWGAAYRDFLAQYYTRHAAMVAQTEVLPYPDQTIDLDPEVRDAWGLPAPRLTYDWRRPNELACIAFMQIKMEEIGRAMGASLIWRAPVSPAGAPGAHHEGGTRMGSDPRSSVVNRYGQSWDVPNLFVIGSSTLITIDEAWITPRPRASRRPRSIAIGPAIGSLRSARGVRMRRREFMAGLGAAITGSIRTNAQQLPPVSLVGYLYAGPAEGFAFRQVAFRKGLAETDYFEGCNVAIETHWARNESFRLADLANELVGRGVAVLVASGNAQAVLAAKAATTTIPIVFGLAADPVEIGLVSSLDHPGGNITGVTSISVDIGSKPLGLLRDLLPRANRVAMLISPNDDARVVKSMIEDALGAAIITGQKIEVFYAGADSSPKCNSAA
jgi:ABC transporter substrate binding protein/GMC oxidoreductase